MRKLDAIVAQQAADLPRKAAARLLGRSLHEENDFGLIHKPTHAFIKRFRIRCRRSGGRSLVSLGKRWWDSAGRARMFRDGFGEGGGVCSRDAVEKCVALRPGGKMVPKGEANNGRNRRTLSMIKVGTLSMSNDSAMSDCSSASIKSESNFGYFRASSVTTADICLHGSAHGAQK